MERPSGIFWCTACKPLNTVWLIIPDSRGKSHCIVYYTRLIHSYTSTKSCSVTLRDTLRTGARIYDICIYLQWALTGEQPLKLNSRIMSQAQSPPQGSEKRCETCREMRHPIILTFIRPIPETASCSTLQFPPPQLLCPVPHCLWQEMQCYAIKTYQGMKNSAPLLNVLPLSAE